MLAIQLIGEAYERLNDLLDNENAGISSDAASDLEEVQTWLYQAQQAIVAQETALFAAVNLLDEIHTAKKERESAVILSDREEVARLNDLLTKLIDVDAPALIANAGKTRPKDDGKLELLRTVKQYLMHPDVRAMGFFIPSEALADRLQTLIDAVEKGLVI
jgi:hypothetical protein